MLSLVGTGPSQVPAWHFLNFVRLLWRGAQGQHQDDGEFDVRPCFPRCLLMFRRCGVPNRFDALLNREIGKSHFNLARALWRPTQLELPFHSPCRPANVRIHLNSSVNIFVCSVHINLTFVSHQGHVCWFSPLSCGSPGLPRGHSSHLASVLTDFAPANEQLLSRCR